MVVIATAAFIALIGWGALTTPPDPVTPDVTLVAENVSFSATEVLAAAGELSVSLTNRDLFWHTFTIDEPGVDLRVPVGAELSVTFQASPGEYRFYCASPVILRRARLGPSPSKDELVNVSRAPHVSVLLAPVAPARRVR